MNSQELFDLSVSRLIAQGKPALDNGGYCRYLTETGLKCAVGILLEDGEYTQHMEYKSLREVVTNNLLPKRLIEHYDLLKNLQIVHDNEWYDPEDLESFYNIAKRFKLDWNFDEIKST